MKRTLVALAVCLAVLLGGVAWITATALRLETQAALEETVRLALWRLDSELAPLLAREAAHAGSGYVETDLPHDVRAYFEVDPSGRVEIWPTDSPLAAILDRGTLAAAPAPRAALNDLSSRSANEYLYRSKNALQAQSALRLPDVDRKPTELRAEWRAGHLLLVRRLGDTVQGLELDWDALRKTLLADVRDLLPEADLGPAGADAPAARLLASLPIRLEPGRLAASPSGETRLVLGAAWVAVLVACATVAALLFGALALGERRGAFVSAVTHELRTPLTTLRTYTEMLEADMVPADKRPGYLRTLAREAERLARLVDNVLAYARLERGRRPERVVTTTAALLERAKPLLEERAAAAGVELTVTSDGAEVKADPSAVEQILFNLVENACKYGGGTPIRVAARGPVLEVKDGGPGIGERRRLFEPFHRSAERAAGSAPGVGLGLALCRRLARTMGGDLVLLEGPGAVFQLRLPAA